MASDRSASAGSSPSAQVVGNAFVHQYYHILHRSPQLVFRFYQEASSLGRPDPQGEMSSVNGMDAINEKILSVDYSKFGAVIKTVDAQESLDGGVIVLVTGHLIGNDNVRKNFTQTFFLATQDKGYYVLNDVFRYVDDDDDQRGSGTLTCTSNEPLAPEQESPQELVQHGSVAPEEDELTEEEVYDPPKDEETPPHFEEVPAAEMLDEMQSSSQAVSPDPSSSGILEEVPKKSYASIVKVMKENPAALPSAAPVPRKLAVASTEPQASPTSTPALPPESASPGSSSVDNNSTQESEVVGYSIYIKNLPLNATPEQLEEEFMKFGPIKPGGIQVRSHKQQGFCFGFVEFEVASAVDFAIEASPITIGGRQAFVEEKRPSSSRVTSKGRFLPGRGGGYRYEGMRGRGIYGGRVYGRGDYNRTDFIHRGGGRGGSSNRGSDVGYQRVDQAYSGGRGNRSGSNFGNWASQKSSSSSCPVLTQVW